MVRAGAGSFSFAPIYLFALAAPVLCGVGALPVDIGPGLPAERSRESFRPFPGAVVDAQDLQGVPGDTIGDEIAGTGHDQLPGARYPFGPAHVWRVRQPQDRLSDVRVQRPGGGGIFGKDVEIDIPQVAAGLR